jgi:SAM-dependent methyltransferase
MIAALVTWRRFVPAGARRRLRPVRHAYVEWRKRRPVNLGDLRRTTPIDPNWGFERGIPIDRMYVERFLASHASDIRGRVLEIGAPDYTRKLGTGVERSDVLHAKPGNPEATIVGDLTDAPQIPSDSFDCAILTQVLQYVYDVRAALGTLHRVLAPGGVLLATVPGITKISAVDDALWGEWWHYTARSLRRLAGEAFGEENVEVWPFGNVLTAAGFLYGLAATDLTLEELETRDRLYEVTIGLRAIKRPLA